MSALPEPVLPEPTPAPTYRMPETGYLPDESQISRMWIGIVVGIPVATVIGGGIFALALMGTPAAGHTAVLALPFGALFGLLGGGIGGLMATMRH